MEQEETRKAQREAEACRQTIASLEAELGEARSEARECRQRAAEVSTRCELDSAWVLPPCPTHTHLDSMGGGVVPLTCD